MTTTIRNESFFCTCCGSSFKVKMPCDMIEYTKKMDAFSLLHKDCEQTWEEPKADMSADITKRANWWMQNGETGMSSKTMWSCFMGTIGFGINYPYDPDDFSRCYKLLESIPEWKERLSELKKLSWQWSNLVDNWDKLTEFYEDMLKVKKGNGMYEYMQTLIT